jgi:ribosomal protein RSM22 (predicted rRNA methylase)
MPCWVLTAASSDVDFGPLSASWHKMLPELPVAEGEGETLALSAFALSGLPSPLARKQLVREMWASGADTIVLVDHSGLAGFEAIAEARHMLLTLGRKELEAGMEVSDIEVEPPAATETAEADAEASPSEDAGPLATTTPTGAPRPLGSYALAPCPHDGACPLYQPENRAHRLACGFSQRLQRPAFVRRTKRAGAGHEDVGYAYVVVRRGVRPVRTEDAVRRGRVGLVGRWEIEALEAKIRGAVPPAELQEVDGTAESEAPASADASVPVAADATPAPDGPLAAALRAEAHAWPRLVFPPLKRSGHVILDVCAPSGRIERATVPRSQGRQPYHDARKARWGDLFPHAPKNAPVVRHVPPDGRGPVRGADIGKRGGDVDADARRAREQTKARRKEAEKARKMEARAEKRKTKWEREGEDEDEDRD